MTKNSDLKVNFGDRTIEFGGMAFTGWAHVRWLRAQLKIMEGTGLLLWGPEDRAEALEKQNKATVLTMIPGGKQNGDKT